MTTQKRIEKILTTVRLGWIIPFIKLAQRDNPKAQVQAIFQQVVTPLLAILVFLLIWQAVSTQIQTKFGTVPGPKQVLQAWDDLMDEAKREREKEVSFQLRQEERNKALLARDPSAVIKPVTYSGKDTYIDQIVTSLITVFAGFCIASIIAIPLGLICGLSPTIQMALNPFIQIFKPVSPLAWLPIVWIVVGALYTSENPWFELSFINSAITVALCSLWPTLVNTAVGVSSMNPDYDNVARVLKLSWFTKIRKIVIPAALPLIFTGLRLSLGVGWMVLIAAEMLAQNPGLGKFVWDMFQNGSSQTLAMIMVAVFTIGIIGFALDTLMLSLQQWVSQDQALM